MSKAFYVFVLVLILAVFAVLMLAQATDADAAELDPDCPKPWVKVRIFLANVSQCLGQYCGQEHSGPPDGEPVR